MNTVDRRGFLRLASSRPEILPPRRLRQQQAPAGVTGVQPTGRYAMSLIYERKPFTWPGGKQLAVWVAPNVEVWDFDSTLEAAITPDGGPGLDVINYASRDYGIRQGLSRVADVLDRAGIKATVALNSAACALYPKQMAAMASRGWEFMAHGVTNSRTLRNLTIDQEREVIQTSVRTIESATGTRVRGWLSPGQFQTANTLDLLAEAGLTYTADWVNDDQPYRMNVRSGEFFSIPYAHVINDVELISKGTMTGAQYAKSVIDQFDQLLIDSRTQPRVLGLPLHPFLTGQPDRIAHLERAIRRIASAEGVWLATGSDIIDAFRRVKS
jgi:peptidoglycan/xylan/chitin deacetylase (PgdA/CDA1 family)